ncbi:hypothetical protein BG32_00015 [Mesotoga sp. HF07.pep.5.2.highcov]|jgi:hypothetical protein|uniref:DUF6305 domain-containing protein n=2 Tax=Mesotoga TaxID=1184396 RepID=I2F6Q7_9BACT|nr:MULTISPECIES: DUF6305 family protein [Mesotoga]AFK07610.1 hypothetical protein Theba_1967 [Mesotoga prima MesG1.Ag.4.2]PIJ63546.1 hypothetical protein V513_00120 [Mesotoga sp. H07.pep.5.3]RLL91297.1 hypothetical protein BG32_00015 [Mesotoga sp. HF07.pep.5.2.highcov]CCU84497.1 conserved exported hypothetical protein [Mesotoga infera]
MRKIALGFLLLLILAVPCTMLFSEEIEMPVVQPPMVVTTLGQSPGALMFRLVCVRNQIACVQEDLLTVEKLVQLVEGENPPKTLVITTGTSLKGMGAAGIDMNFEVKRVEGLIAKAKELGMTIIGAHIEGMARRVDATDEKSISTVMPKSDLILVIEDSDSDGFFTNFSNETGIPLVKVKESLEIGPALKKLFQE